MKRLLPLRDLAHKALDLGELLHVRRNGNALPWAEGVQLVCRAVAVFDRARADVHFDTVLDKPSSDLLTGNVSDQGTSQESDTGTLSTALCRKWRTYHLANAPAPTGHQSDLSLHSK